MTVSHPTGPDLQIHNPAFIESMVGRRSDTCIDGFLGIRHEDISAGRLVVEFAVEDQHLSFIGIMHGGCLAALCDHCLGVVLYPVMPPGSWAATTEFKVNYLKPVSGGICRATAIIEAMTKRSAVVSVRVENVTDAGTRLVALAQGTCTVKLADERPD
jgi:uncharacterized protein (TIGR00369 family)